MLQIASQRLAAYRPGDPVRDLYSSAHDDQQGKARGKEEEAGKGRALQQDSRRKNHERRGKKKREHSRGLAQVAPATDREDESTGVGPLGAGALSRLSSSSSTSLLWREVFWPGR